MFGPRLSQLHEMLGEAVSFEERVRIANGFFRAMPAPALKWREMDLVIQEMIAKKGCIRVQYLAHDAGLSVRQFDRRFTSVLGISPKVFADSPVRSCTSQKISDRAEPDNDCA